jgi:hypothetical protein
MEKNLFVCLPEQRQWHHGLEITRYYAYHRHILRIRGFFLSLPDFLTTR